MEYNIGDKIIILAVAEVVRKSNAHGLCYKVQIPQRDYNHNREIFLDPDEIAGPATPALLETVKEIMTS
jgi:hypothetical protein